MTIALSASIPSLHSTLPVNSLDAYIANVQRAPMLSEAEEIGLAEKLQEFNDIEAARQLVFSHLRFVVKIARGYLGYGLALGDLIQEGNVGLMKAVKRFDPKVGVRLVSFAVHWVKAEIHEFIIRNWRIVKVATTKAQRKLFFNLRSSKRKYTWFTADEVKHVADTLGVKATEVQEMEKRLAAFDASFDMPVDDDSGTYNPAFIPAHFLEDNQDPATQLEQDDWQQQHYAQLQQGLSQLDERSQTIIHARWLEDKKTTLTDLAQRFGVSAERIRQLEKDAFKKLREQISTAP